MSNGGVRDAQGVVHTRVQLSQERGKEDVISPHSVPLVSVLLPVFNGHAYVADAIQSIRRQTFRDWELLVCDDASSDRSAEVLRQLGHGDTRIKVFQNERNVGLAGTLNRLFRASVSCYVAIQEQDDISRPDRLSREVEVLENNPRVGVVSGIAEWVDEQDRVFTLFPGVLARGMQYPQDKLSLVRYLLLEQCKVVNAACMFRRSVAEQLAGPFDADATMSIDWQFFLHVAHRHAIVGIPEVLVRMRRGSTHRSLTKDKARQFREARRCIRLMYHKYSKEDSPIRWPLFRRAMARQLTLEGRYYGNVTAISRLAQALAWWPFDAAAWRACGQLGKRAMRKIYGR